MDIKIKRWTHLGLGAALMTTTALASCGEPAAKASRLGCFSLTSVNTHSPDARQKKSRVSGSQEFQQGGVRRCGEPRRRSSELD